MDPRISFSNDFVDTQQSVKIDNIYKEAPVSSDFDFSVKDNCMISADEIFFQGMLLPMKDICSNQMIKTTLRDELLVGGDCEDVLPRLPKSSGWWKERLCFKKPHISSKRDNKNNGILERVEEEKGDKFLHDDNVLIAKKTQELLFEGGLKFQR